MKRMIELYQLRQELTDARTAVADAAQSEYPAEKILILRDAAFKKWQELELQSNISERRPDCSRG
jgi:hypothetical protein